MRILVLLLSLSLSLSLAAQEKVYKKVHPDGTVEYSDKPIEGGELMNVPRGTIITMPKPSGFKAAETTADRKAAARKQAEEHAAAYTRFEILRPKDDEAIRSNAGNLTAQLALEPGIVEGDRLRWKLDGNPIEGAGGLTLILRNVDRGTHTLQAEILDADGKVVKTTPVVTFHLLRYAGGPVPLGQTPSTPTGLPR